LWGYLGHDLGGGLLELGNLLGGGVHLHSLGLPLHCLLLQGKVKLKVEPKEKQFNKVKI
jgi:hypothetical protein